VDFLQLPHYPIFNIADSAIVSAAVLIAVMAFRGVSIDGTRISGDKPENASTDSDKPENDSAETEIAAQPPETKPTAGTSHDV